MLSCQFVCQAQEQQSELRSAESSRRLGALDLRSSTKPFELMALSFRGL